MQESILLNISIEFSVKIISLCESIKGKTAITNQLIRSGTSIGANIHEAQYGNSKPDFISKLHIALKEANETKYWLIVLSKTNSLEANKFDMLSNECEKIKAMLIKSINTAKGR